MDIQYNIKQNYIKAHNVIESYKKHMKITYDDNNTMYDITTGHPNLMEDINLITKEYNLPLEYKLLISYNDYSDSSLVLNKFYFATIAKTNEFMKNKNQTRFIDIGMIYRGMGHYCVLAWDKIEKKCFFREDGGANWVEKEFNQTFFFGTFNPSDEKYKNKLFSFKDTLEIIMNSKYNGILIYRG
jgi:hypothetical protein